MDDTADRDQLDVVVSMRMSSRVRDRVREIARIEHRTMLQQIRMFVDMGLQQYEERGR